MKINWHDNRLKRHDENTYSRKQKQEKSFQHELEKDFRDSFVYSVVEKFLSWK